MSATLKFCGRNQELETLKDLWLRASNIDHPSPQVVVIKAGRGIGKTRLALEFYRWLSENNDPDNYWPDALEIIDRNLQINPNPEKCKFENAAIPHLWWGLRACDPKGENSVGGDSVATYDSYLALHLVTLLIRARALKTGKNLVLTYAEIAGDYMIEDLPTLLGLAIPHFGLALGLGKALYKTIRIGREEYLQGKLDAAREKPQSRADAVLEDLERIFNPKSLSFAKTAGVILIDDAQFAANDATLLEFSERLIHAAATQKWPLMVIVTHWRDEFQKSEDNTKSFVKMIHHARSLDPANAKDPGAEWPAGYLLDESYCEMDLWVVDDLSEALTEHLPGLKPDQAKAILDRAGGNPRFLEQMVKLLLENERYFEDLDVSKPLTAKGLFEALEKTTSIFDVVMERLRGAPPEVQEAICLASVQGMRFSSSIAEEFAQAALNKSLRGPLTKAENPYSMVVGSARTESEAIGEFAERLFYEVAAKRRENIKGLHDEAALETALKQILTARLDDPTFEERSHIDDRALTYRLAANVFDESNDAEDTSKALHALARLVDIEDSRHSFQSAVEAAESFAQLAVESRQLIITLYPIDFLSIINTLRRAGNYDQASILLKFWLPYVLDIARNPNSPDDGLALAAVTLWYAGDLMVWCGENRKAEDYYEQSLYITRELSGRPNFPDALVDVARLLKTVGHLAGQRGDLQKMEHSYEESLSICRGLIERLNAPTALRELAAILKNYGSLEMDRGDKQKAAEHYEESLNIFRDLAGRINTPVAMSDLADTLKRFGSLAWSCGDHGAANQHWKESLAIYRDLARRINTPESLQDLAGLLNNTGLLTMDRGNYPKAAECFEESLAIYRDLALRVNTPMVLAELALALTNFGILEKNLGNKQEAAGLYQESLAINRDLARRINTPESLNSLASALNNSGLLAMACEDYQAAEKYFDEGLKIQRDLTKQWNMPKAREVHATLLFNAGLLEYERGAYQLAAEHYDECLNIRRNLVELLKTPVALKNLSKTLLNAGNIATKRRNHSFAAELYGENVNTLRKLPRDSASHEMEAHLSNALLLSAHISAKNDDFSTALACVTEGRAIAAALPESIGHALVLEFDALIEEIEVAKS